MHSNPFFLFHFWWVSIAYRYKWSDTRITYHCFACLSNIIMYYILILNRDSDFHLNRRKTGLQRTLYAVQLLFILSIISIFCLKELNKQWSELTRLDQRKNVKPLIQCKRKFDENIYDFSKKKVRLCDFVDSFARSNAFM